VTRDPKEEKPGAAPPSPMTTDPRVSVVLPTFNERAAFALLYPRLARVVTAMDGELIVVDDGSPDGTAAFVRGLGGPPASTVIERPGVRGLASAVLAGIARARAGIVVVMDADGSHPPEVVPSLVEALTERGAEMALGSRRVPGGSAPAFSGRRRIVSGSARALARPLTNVRDPMSGLFAVRSAVLRRGQLAPIGYKIALEVIVKCRPDPLVEVPFVFGPRLAGESKLDGREMARYLRHIARLYAFEFAGARRASRTR
jgi:dolichol-phosphate mannosyltransferase